MRRYFLMNPANFLGITIFLPGFLLSMAGVLSPAPATGPFAGQSEAQEDSDVRERLTYHIAWHPPWYLFFLPPMEAGEAVLSLSGEAPHRDRKAVKITFEAKSSGTLVRLAGISIDDRFEFTTDAETFCTIAVSKKEREGKRMRDIDVVYLPESRKLHLREVDVSQSVHKVLRDQDYEGIPPCVQDLFSALYALRRKNLSAGSTTRALVGDNHHVKEVQVHVEKKLRVSTRAGSFDAWQLNTIALVGGLFKGGGQFRMWLSADERKLPVKFEAEVSLGKVTGSLENAKY